MKKIKAKAVRCIDLFCGAGGLTHGFELEGLRVAAGIDLDPSCQYPYETNNQAKFVKQGVECLSGSQLDKYFGSSDIRILAGCAPCQPFSTYTQGQNNRNDSKWGLLYQFSRLAGEIKPSILTMENVPSVSRHVVFSDFVISLRDMGYDVWHDVIECSDYGVPQNRRRMVLLASKFGPIAMIPPTLKNPKTVRQSIGRFGEISAGERSSRDRLHVSASLSPLNMKRIKVAVPGGSWRDWPKSLVADCHQISSGKTYPSVYGRMEWDKPSPTITTQCFGFGNGRFGHPAQNRAISLREAAILQGFPRSYKFVPGRRTVEFRTVGRLIGNAVPVHLARAIARSIISHIQDLDTESSRRKPVKKHQPTVT